MYRVFSVPVPVDLDPFRTKILKCDVTSNDLHGSTSYRYRYQYRILKFWRQEVTHDARARKGRLPALYGLSTGICCITNKYSDVNLRTCIHESSYCRIRLLVNQLHSTTLLMVVNDLYRYVIS